MEMLDSEEILTQSEHAEAPLREYGALVDKIDKCFEDIITLKHEIEKVEEKKHMAAFDLFPDLEKYDRTIKMLTEAQSYIKSELSVYEKRALELRPDVYCAKTLE